MVPGVGGWRRVYVSNINPGSVAVLWGRGSVGWSKDFIQTVSDKTPNSEDPEILFRFDLNISWILSLKLMTVQNRQDCRHAIGYELNYRMPTKTLISGDIKS